MITISLCMIVKNEEAVLKRCLDCVKDLMDEIIIVDTGSTDRTKEIAAEYTNQVYDFTWCDDFAAARNFAFGKANMDYIYAPDADEVIDSKNHRRFQILKQCMVPEIEIVQMHYLTRTVHNTVENFADELRPKLFKRLRTFTWVDPVHETVRLMPLVFDSDVEILHLPQESHGKRDFSIFEKNINKEEGISDRIGIMYAKELYKCGDEQDIENALPYFSAKLEDPEMWAEASIIWARYLRQTGDLEKFQKTIVANLELYCYSEICYEIGTFCLDIEETDVAMEWFHRAMETAEPILSVEAMGILPLEGLSKCYEIQGNTEEAEKYLRLAASWKLPSEMAEGE